MYMIKCFSIKILLIEFYFLIWSRAADTLKDQVTDLGQNVTINCYVDDEVYWLFLKQPHPPVMILRSMLSGPFYNSVKLKPKYSVQMKYHLFINNVTHDEIGVYYCMRIGQNDVREFGNGTRLYIIEPAPEIRNNTVLKCIEHNTTQWLVVVSGLMNGVLLIVLAGLLKVVACGSRRTSQNSKTAQDDLQQPQVRDLEQAADSDQSQYAEVNFTTPHNHIPLNSTYALVQMHKSQT